MFGRSADKCGVSDIKFIIKIKKRVMLGAITSLFIALMFFIPSSTVFVEAADTIIVDDDGTGDYLTIQAAINNAAIGDNIVVKDGTYVEQLTVNVPSISIVAASGETPVIYIGSYAFGIDVTAPDVLIEGFEIFGNSSSGGFYPAIKASSGSNGLTVTNNEFKVFTGEIGSLGLQVDDTVNNIDFNGNTVINYDRGVLLDGISWALINGNTFTNVNSIVSHAAVISALGVDRYFGSIQYAIDNAFSGNTINVLEGTYIENVLINKSLTINGAMAGINPVVGRSGYESIVDGNTNHAITVSTGITDVTINGFTVTIPNKTNGNNGAGVLISNNTDDIVVTCNIIEDITDGSGADTTADESYGIMVYGRDATGGQSNITITNNLIRNVEEYGIAINDKTSNVIIEDNKIVDMIGSDHALDPYWDPSWPSQICAAIHLGGQVGPIVNVNIDDNILNTNVIGDGSTSAAGGGISFAGVADWLNPSRIWEGFEQITVTENDITNNSMGIIALEGKFNDNLSIHSNDISNNNLYGINNVIVNTTFNATNNWWGNINGPYHSVDNPGGTGVTVSDNVTFWPWYEFDGYSIKPSVEYEVGHPNSEDGLYVKSITSIKIKASDNESGMKSLTYRIWNTTHYWSEWYNYTNSLNLYGEGKHKVEYNATDMAGTKRSDIETHYVDDEGPWVEVQDPNGGEFIRGDLAIHWDAADKIPDQKQVKRTGFYPLSEDYPGHIQSFVPTHDTLNAVDLILHGDEAEVSVMIFSDIIPVPIPIGTTSKHLEDVGNGAYPDLITFPFDSEIPLEIGKVYYIGVSQDVLGSTGINWHYYNSTGGSDPYPHGQSWIKKVDTLELQPEIDWTFITNFWNEDIDITIQFSSVNPPIWSTIVQGEDNDGGFIWDTTSYPDGESYLIRVIAEDFMSNSDSDASDGTFVIDNTGPAVYNVMITDTTLGSTEYTKDGDRIEISATISGEIDNITADLSGFGKGSSVAPNSLYGDTATWIVNSVNCAPANGEITVTITVIDPNDDFDQSSGTIIADNAPPVLEISRPLPGIFIFDGQRLLPYPYPVIFGQITIKVDANDMGAGIERVDIYLEGRLREVCSEIPYEWVWDEASIGFFKIEAIAYDNVGFNSTASVNDVFIINLDIWD
jgi:hypothetical protein